MGCSFTEVSRETIDPADKVGERDFTVGRCTLLRGHVLQRAALRLGMWFCLVLVDALYERVFLGQVPQARQRQRGCSRSLTRDGRGKVWSTINYIYGDARQK